MGDGGGVMGALIAVKGGWAGEWVDGWSVCMYVIIGVEY